MTDARRIGVGMVVWLIAITTAHVTLNVDWDVMLNDRLPESRRKLNVAYIPVT